MFKCEKNGLSFAPPYIAAPSLIAFLSPSIYMHVNWLRNFKSLETGETFINNRNKHLLYRVEYINAFGTFSAYFDILKPTESLTKTNPVNKVKIYF